MDLDLDAGIGAFAVTGSDASFPRLRNINAQPASYAIVGTIPVNIDGYFKAFLGNGSKVLAVNDFIEAVRDNVSYWKLEGETGSNQFVELPCQYWKATTWSYRADLPDGGTNYVEVMVPAATDYADEINDSYSFRIKQFFKLPDGSELEHVFFNFGSYLTPPLPLTKSFTSGAYQDSCLIKGSFRLLEPIESYLEETRALTGIRSNGSTDRGRRIICNFDPVLLPGMFVEVGNDTFEAKTVIYYVSASDQYLEVYDYHI